MRDKNLRIELDNFFIYGEVEHVVRENELRLTALIIDIPSKLQSDHKRIDTIKVGTEYKVKVVSVENVKNEVKKILRCITHGMMVVEKVNPIEEDGFNFIEITLKRIAK